MGTNLAASTEAVGTVWAALAASTEAAGTAPRERGEVEGFARPAWARSSVATVPTSLIYSSQRIRPKPCRAGCFGHLKTAHTSRRLPPSLF